MALVLVPGTKALPKQRRDGYVSHDSDIISSSVLFQEPYVVSVDHPQMEGPGLRYLTSLPSSVRWRCCAHPFNEVDEGA